MKLSEVAALLEGKLENADHDQQVIAINSLSHATSQQVAFLANKKYIHDVEHSQAGLLLLSLDMMPELSRPILRVTDPYIAYAKLQAYFHPQQPSMGYRDTSAMIHPDAYLADNVDIAAGVIIAAGVHISEGCRIDAGCVIEKNVRLGTKCYLHAHVIVRSESIIGHHVIIQSGAVIGSDGFGFAWSGSEFVKIPQVGHVVIEDHAEIGANTCIDRAAIGETRIGMGVKIDNLVQIAHNVEIGAHTVIAGQAGFAGSAKVGKGCQFGGQSAVAGHTEIKDGCLFAGKSGVVGNVDKAGNYAGHPAIPLRNWLRSASLFARLPELWRSFVTKK